MAETSIQWTDHSINPIRARNKKTGAVGHYCEKISKGCTNCYASAFQKRFGMPAFVGARIGLPTLPIGENNCVSVKEDIEIFLDVDKLFEVIARRKPTKYFWCDMTDIAGSWVPDEWLDMMFATMAIARQHTHQVLTKRPDRLAEYFDDPTFGDDPDQLLARWGAGGGNLLDGPSVWKPFNKKHRPAIEAFISQAYGVEEDKQAGGFFPSNEPVEFPLPNVWIGTSVEDRATTSRLEMLSRIPAAIRFASFEPLLEDLGDFNAGAIDWAIFGGESGAGARQCVIDWIRKAVKRCRMFNVAPYVKQLGKFAVDCLVTNRQFATSLGLKDEKGGDPAEWPADLRVREFPVARCGR